SRVFLALVVACLALLAGARWTRRPAAAPAEEPTVVAQATSQAGAAVGSVPVPDALPPVVPATPLASETSPQLRTPVLAQRALLEARRRFQYSVRATYLDSVFASPDSVIRRWPDDATIRVAIAPDS